MAQETDPSIMPIGLGEVHPLRQIPGRIGGVIARFTQPVQEAPNCHSDHYVRDHFVTPIGSAVLSSEAFDGTQPDDAA